ncbi:MAG: hypothetical protein ABJA90_08260 [Ginsengibacter sp.]
MSKNLIGQNLRALAVSFLFFISLSILFDSCLVSKNKKAMSKSPATLNTDSESGSSAGTNIDEVKTNTAQPVYNLNPPFALLTANYDDLLKVYKMGNFHKFKVIPYQRKAGDDVRLYCYALSTDYEASKLGQAFYLSSDGSGEIPRTLFHPIIYDDLALSKEDMKQILSAEPVAVIYLTLVPLLAIENGKPYNTYRVYKNGHDTKVQFKLSPKNFN